MLPSLNLWSVVIIGPNMGRGNLGTNFIKKIKEDMTSLWTVLTQHDIYMN